MTPIATGIAREHIELVWPWWWPLIKPAYERSDEKPAPAEILRQIKNQELTVWAIFCDNKPIAGILVRLQRHVTSGHRICRIWLVGGTRMSEWLPDFLSKLIPWAKQEGCVALVGSGRKGWARYARRLGCVRIEDESGGPAWRLDI